MNTELPQEQTIPERIDEPMAAGPTLLEIARGRLDGLRHLLEGAHTPDAEYVHDLRVITRRLTEGVRLMRPLMEKGAGRSVTEALRDLRRSTGELRDLDVMEEHVRELDMPEGLWGMREALLSGMPARRETLVEHLRHAMASPGLAGAMAFLTQLMGQAADGVAALEKELARTIRRRRKQLRAELGEAALQQTQHQFHAARIAAKKLRYGLELADESGLNAGVKVHLAFLKEMQGHLGDMHDVDVILQTLEGHVAEFPQAMEAWAGMKREMMQKQAKRAAGALMRGYQWMNGLMEE